MRLRPEQLAQHLSQQLLPVYLVTGDELLLVQECSDLIRQHARKAGCAERELIDTGVSGFKWHDLLHSAASMSLFAERKLVELRIPNGKPGAEGSKALQEYLSLASGDDILLIIAGKIDKQSTRSKWFTALDKAGAVTQVWPVGLNELPRWLDQRVLSAGMRIDQDALQLLCERVEGNLLAAVQEVEKLKLLATDNLISVETVTSSVSSSARYNLFDMADKALAGDAAASLRMLRGLRGEGAEPTVALWALSKEIRTLHQVQEDCDQGQSVNQAMSARRVWNNRMGLMQTALSRHTSASLTGLLKLAAQVDGSIKGMANGRPWDKLEELVLALCRRA